MAIQAGKSITSCPQLVSVPLTGLERMLSSSLYMDLSLPTSKGFTCLTAIIAVMVELARHFTMPRIPRVYVLGPPTVDRKLVCAALASKLNLVYLTQQSLNPQEEATDGSEGCSQLSCSEWAKLMKERVEQPDCVKNGWLMEAFPKTRRQAFALRKAGVFPTHIVVIDDPVISQRVTLRSCPEISDILSEEGLQEMLDYLGQVDLILDLHAKSYAKKFRIGYHEDVEKSLEKGLCSNFCSFIL
ncbi:Adenylate kinase 8 [Araneus ventricosus]|uniref:Adenylate kinase 8 n=1 Tax=Araneus ventricosus TaxID=182803 RepID=A0A4Y2RG78_ARAVE|nr:Adenylate kinase 8 [Araneus ventricosus]